MNSNKKALILVPIVVAFIAAILTTLTNNSPAFIWVLFGMSLFSLIYRGNTRKIYLLSLSANIIFGCIVIYVFQKNGSLFEGGGDDERFYDYFREALNGHSEFYEFRYGNFLLLGSNYIRLLKSLGVSEITPLIIYPLNWFYGANVCSLAYIFAKQIGLTKQNAYKCIVLLCIYPFFLVSEVKILREILSTLMLMSFFVVYYSHLKKAFKILIIGAIMAFTMRVRGEYILYMVIFMGIDVFYNLYFRNKKIAAYSLVVIGLVGGVLMYSSLMQLTGRGDQSINDLSKSYVELRASSAEESLGAKLKTAGPILLPVVVLYLWISPFPPPVVQGGDIVFIIISLGVIFWYNSFVKFPVIIRHYILKYKNNIDLKQNVIKLLIFVLICSVMVAATSADVRHISSFYPIMFIVFTIVLQEYPSKNMKSLKFIGLVGAVILFSIYFVIKGA